MHAKAGRDAKNGTDMQLSTHRGTQGSRQRRAGVCLKPELEKWKFFVPTASDDEAKEETSTGTGLPWALGLCHGCVLHDLY